MRLPSQVALVTGAASGIARAVAVRFACEGALVAVWRPLTRFAPAVEEPCLPGWMCRNLTR